MCRGWSTGQTNRKSFPVDWAQKSVTVSLHSSVESVVSYFKLASCISFSRPKNDQYWSAASVNCFNWKTLLKTLQKEQSAKRYFFQFPATYIFAVDLQKSGPATAATSSKSVHVAVDLKNRVSWLEVIRSGGRVPVKQNTWQHMNETMNGGGFGRDVTTRGFRSGYVHPPQVEIRLIKSLSLFRNKLLFECLDLITCNAYDTLTKFILPHVFCFSCII